MWIVARLTGISARVWYKVVQPRGRGCRKEFAIRVPGSKIPVPRSVEYSGPEISKVSGSFPVRDPGRCTEEQVVVSSDPGFQNTQIPGSGRYMKDSGIQGVWFVVPACRAQMFTNEGDPRISWGGRRCRNQGRSPCGELRCAGLPNIHTRYKNPRSGQ